MNTIREIERINHEELERGIAGTPASWHSQYAGSAWVYAGNLDHSLTEGDVLCVLSQYGEIDDIHLIREEDTGKSKGFAFVKYQDARSCVLAVDNLVGVEVNKFNCWSNMSLLSFPPLTISGSVMCTIMQVCGRSLRIDHVERYKLPKHVLEKEDANVHEAGQAYKGEELENEFSLQKGHDLFAQPSSREQEKQTKRQRKEERKRKREERLDRRREREARRAKKESKKKH